MSIVRVLSLMALTACLSGCLKDELPVPASDLGPVTLGQACIGTDYSGQIWYDIGTNKSVGSNSKMEGDLACECGTEGWHERRKGWTWKCWSRRMRRSSIPTA